MSELSHQFDPGEFTRRTGYASFAEMYQELSPRMRRYALRLSRNSADAEDIVQDALIKVLRFVNIKYEPGTNFKSWIFKVTHNAAMNYLERRSRRFRDDQIYANPLTAELSGNYGQQPPLDERLDSLETLWERASKPLRSEFKAVLELVVLQGMTYGQISQTLRIPLGTVMSRLHRARKVLGRK